MHLDDRISIEPGNPSKGQEVRIEYQGMLAQSGADNMWMHCGFDGWYNVQDIPMHRNPQGSFSCNIKAEGDRELNFCFKDSADHWDNNSGWNWAAPIK